MFVCLFSYPKLRQTARGSAKGYVSSLRKYCLRMRKRIRPVYASGFLKNRFLDRSTFSIAWILMLRLPLLNIMLCCFYFTLSINFAGS